MQITVLAFGIAKDIISGSQLNLKVADGQTVGELKTTLCQQFPAFEQLRSLKIAVNTDYRPDDFVLKENDEIVIIPPVSGG